MSKAEKFNQELIKIQHRNNGKLFQVNKAPHKHPPLNPFFTLPSQSSLLLFQQTN